MQSLLPFNRVVWDGFGPNLVPVVVCHGHGHSGLAAGDEAYGIVVVAGVYFSVLLAADGLVAFQTDGDGFPGAAQFDAVGSEAILFFTVVCLQYQSGQSSQFPGTFAYGNAFSKPGRPVASLEVVFCFPARHAEQAVGFFGQSPLRPLLLFLVADVAEACHSILGGDMFGREILADDFGQM